MTIDWSYLLSSAGWALAGVVAHMVWTRIVTARAAKRGDSKKAMSADSAIAVIVILVGIVSALFSAADRLQFAAYQRCQAQVDAQFRAGYLDRSNVAAQDREAVDNLVNAIVASNFDEPKIKAALTDYNAERAMNDQQRAANPVVVTGTCKQPKGQS